MTCSACSLGLEKYLLKHKDEFDRVVFADLRDVYWFADGFQTIDPNELVVMLECDDFDENKDACIKSKNDNNVKGCKAWVHRTACKATRSSNNGQGVFCTEW